MNRCSWVKEKPLEIAYHDEEWGIPITDDQKLFEFLILEGAQAGKSQEYSASETGKLSPGKNPDKTRQTWTNLLFLLTQ